MKRMMLFVVTGVFALAVGCGGNSDESTGNSVAAAPSSNAAGKLVNSSGISNAIIPPNEIVAMFADSIRRGDRETVNKLITEASRLEIQKQGIDLDPPGSPDASYKIGEFRFSDEDKDAGFVESLWIEPGQDGTPPHSTEVVWGVRLENGGWRICGLAIDMGTDQPAALVNFEDLEGAVSDNTPSTDKVASDTTPAVESVQSVPRISANGFAAPPTQLASPPATDNRR